MWEHEATRVEAYFDDNSPTTEPFIKVILCSNFLDTRPISIKYTAIYSLLSEVSCEHPTKDIFYSPKYFVKLFSDSCFANREPI